MSTDHNYVLTVSTSIPTRAMGWEGLLVAVLVPGIRAMMLAWLKPDAV